MRLSGAAATYRVATDVGGTFTDLVGYRVDPETGVAVDPVVVDRPPVPGRTRKSWTSYIRIASA